MEKYEKYIYRSHAHSLSSSSSTKIFCDGERLCSPCGCYRCCNSAFFNDHTYSILKRICHKIIKNRSRQRCRENYSVFDGGNSTIFRPVFKGKKDGADIFNNCMPSESVFHRNGYREQKTTDIRVPDLIRNVNGKGNATWYDNMAKRQNSKKPQVSGEKNENNIGGDTKKFRKGAVRNEKGKKNEETVSINHIDVVENGPNKYNKETKSNETTELRKRKGGTDNDKDVLKKFAGAKGSDRNYDKDEKSLKNNNKGTTEGKDGKNRESKANNPKIDKNVDQGEISKNEDNDRKNRTSKAKHNKIEKNIDQDELKNEEWEEKDKKKRTSIAKHPKIAKNVDQAEANKIEEKKGQDKKNRTSKTKQPKIEKNVDQGEKNQNKEKEGNDKKNTKKAKQLKIEKDKDQGELNRNEEKDGKDRENKTSKTKQRKIEKNVDQGKINKHEDSSKKSGKYTIRENVSGSDKHNDDKDNKIGNISKKKIGSKDRGSYDKSYQAISKKKPSEVFVSKDRIDDQRTQHGKDKLDRIGLVSKTSVKSKFKPGYGEGNQLPENIDTYFRKGTKKGKGSKTLANRKNHISKGIIGMPRELLSCRNVRPCDILRVKLEERDLSRCTTCCLPYRPYISCSSYQYGIPCV